MKWHVEQIPWAGQVDIKIVDQSGHVMAIVTPNLFTSGETADLLAAAPELLAALEEQMENPDISTISDDAQRWGCRHCGREWSAMMGDDEVPENCPSEDCPGFQARAAIARAKGAA